MPRSCHAHRGLFAALLLAIALPAGASEPGRSGAAAPDPRDPAVAPRPALGAAPEAPRPASSLKLRQRPPAGNSRAESFTDTGLERPVLEPTVRERAKLEAARVAIETSRAAGTLYGARERAPRTLTPLWQVEASKLERLRAARPATVTSRPEEMGVTPGSRQKQGPTPLSPAEQAKREAKPASSVTPETAKEGSR